jgi:hypothetical protein
LSYIPRYDKGNWIAMCDVCGRKYKASALTKRWDGLMCCQEDWEIRQPQDFVRGVLDTQIAPWLRTEPSDSFIAVTLGLLSQLFSTSTATILTVFTAAPYNLYITSPVTTTLSAVLLNPSTPAQINGSPINTTTLN